jgi:hypothetical protein
MYLLVVGRVRSSVVEFACGRRRGAGGRQFLSGGTRRFLGPRRTSERRSFRFPSRSVMRPSIKFERQQAHAQQQPLVLSASLR